MRYLLLLPLFLVSCAISPRGTEIIYKEYQSFTIVNQTPYPLKILKGEKEVASDLLPGRVFSFTFRSWLSQSAHIPFIVLSPEGATYRTFTVWSGRDQHRGEVWIVNSSHLRSSW